MKKLACVVFVSFLSFTPFYLRQAWGAAPGSSGDAKAGLEIHKKSCLRCHGERGKGDGPAAKLLKTKPSDWSDKAKMSSLSDQDLFKIITKGGEANGKSKLMPPWEGKLSAQDVTNAIAFIRSLAK